MRPCVRRTHFHTENNLVTHKHILILNAPRVHFSNCGGIESHAYFQFVIGFNSIINSHCIKTTKCHNIHTGASIKGSIIRIESTACFSDYAFIFFATISGCLRVTPGLMVSRGHPPNRIIIL